MTESFAELFEESEKLSKLKPGAIVIGVVVDVRNDVVVINAGLKSEGIVPIEQFRNEAGEIDVGIGDEVKVALDSLENGFGETVLSREKAKRAMVWDELEEALEKNETVTGRISGKVKGGFTVDIKDVRYIIPHQANQRILDAAAKGVPGPAEFISVIGKYGNTSSASVGLALHDAWDRFQTGDLVLLIAFGGGLSWAGALIEW